MTQGCSITMMIHGWYRGNSEAWPEADIPDTADLALLFSVHIIVLFHFILVLFFLLLFNSSL